MSKKKKKSVKLTAKQKLREKASDAATGTLAVLRKLFDSAEKRIPSALISLGSAFSRFVSYKWSAFFLAAAMFSLMMATYYINGQLYLTSQIFLLFPATVTFYLIDYSVGFMPKTMLGEIFSWFTDKISLFDVLAVSRIAAFTMLTLEAVLAALVFKKSFLKKNYAICAAAVLFAASPVTVMAFVYNLGWPDLYNLLIAVLLVYIADTKASLVLTPALCAFSLLIYHGFAVALLPAVLLVHLYYICYEKRLRGARIASFSAAVLISVGLCVYFTVFAKYTVKLSPEELTNYLAGKFREFGEFNVYEEYYTYHIYGDYKGGSYTSLFSFLIQLIRVTFQQIKLYDIIPECVCLVPFFGLLEYVWVFALRRAKKGMRLPYLGFMCLPLLFVATLLLSTDVIRYASHSYLANFIVLAAVVKKDDPLMNDALRRAGKKLDRPWKRAAAVLVTAAYFIVCQLLFLR